MNYFEQLPIDIIVKIVIEKDYNISLMFVNKSLYKLYNDNINIFAYYISENIKKKFVMTDYWDFWDFIDLIMPDNKLFGLKYSNKLYKYIIQI